jgi:hypothetical protein
MHDHGLEEVSMPDWLRQKSVAVETSGWQADQLQGEISL